MFTMEFAVKGKWPAN